MKYNPEAHHRKSIRLKNYDYSKEGLYFITICTHNRENLFGKIIDENVGADLRVCPNDENTNINKLNIAGKMIEKWLLELPNKFKHIKIDEYIIMPNHIHFIIEISYQQGEHIGSPLQTIIQWFKTMSTNEYIKMVKNNELPNFDKRIWQRNYYENIIRNDEVHQKIIEYIENNPLKWKNDKYYM
jgi:REP element-mobilizing transposase RayT